MSGTRHGIAHRLYTGQISYDFIGKRRVWYIFSAILLTISLLALLIRGLSLGIEFSGGTDFQVAMPVSATTIDTVRQEVDAFEVKDLQAQVFSLGEGAIRIQTRSLTPEETTTVRAAIAQLAGVAPDEVTYSSIGASWGQQISRQATIALLVFVVLVMLLIAVWFRDWKMSVAAVLALAHDLIVTVGLYALVGFTVTPATLIGVLTILGYSLYDTVVVFDKIKENIHGLADSRDTYSDRANLAVNQVLVRSINTTIIGVLPVAALLVAGTFLGAGPLQDLGLALFVGMIFGAYSSIFLATPILATLKEREPEQVKHRETIQRRIERAEARERKRAAAGESAGEPTAGSDDATVSIAAGGPETQQGTAQESARQESVRQVRRTNTTRAERRGRK